MDMKTYIGVIVFDDLDDGIFEDIIKTEAKNLNIAHDNIKKYIEKLNKDHPIMHFRLEVLFEINSIEKV